MILERSGLPGVPDWISGDPYPWESSPCPLPGADVDNVQYVGGGIWENILMTDQIEALPGKMAALITAPGPQVLHSLATRKNVKKKRR